MPSEIFDQYSHSLYAYAKKRVQSDEDILDLLQDTFVVYLESGEKFQRLSSPLTYLTGILRNKIYNLYRKQNREFSVSDDDLGIMMQSKSGAAATLGSGSPSEKALENRDSQKVIEACIRRLKSPYYQAFVLRELEELPTEEICKILSVSVTNLNVILHRARQKLQVMLIEAGISNAH